MFARVIQEFVLRRGRAGWRQSDSAQHCRRRNLAHRPGKTRTNQNRRGESEVIMPRRFQNQMPEIKSAYTAHLRAGLVALGVAVVCAVFLAAWSHDQRTAKLTGLECFPPEIRLTSAKSRQQLVVQATYADGVTLDVTTRAKFKLADPQLATLNKAVVSPMADGQSELRVTFGGQS